MTDDLTDDLADGLAWHGPGYPEWRSQRPWVMEEMISSEPRLASMVVTSDAVAPVAAAVGEALAGGQPVAVVGCGTSEHAAMAIAAQMRRALDGPAPLVVARQALEAAADPWPGCCLAISHEGGTAATLAALRAAASVGATTATITAVADSAVAQAADMTLVTPAVDRSWCHTVGYLSPVLAGGALAQRVAGRPVLDHGAVAGLLEAALATRADAVKVAAALAGAERVLVTGSGLDAITARELALKIEEGVRTPAVGRDLETVLHGHLAAGDGLTALVLVLADQHAADLRAIRAGQVLAAAAAVGMPTAVLRGADVSGLVGPVSGGAVILPAAGAVPPALAALATGAVALQWLTLELAHLKGWNPDLIGREVAAQRIAAAAGEQTTAWAN